MIKTLRRLWFQFTGGKTAKDGCDLDFTVDPLADEDVEAFVLFADVDPESYGAVKNREDELKELFG